MENEGTSGCTRVEKIEQNVLHDMLSGWVRSISKSLSTVHGATQPRRPVPELVLFPLCVTIGHQCPE